MSGSRSRLGRPPTRGPIDYIDQSQSLLHPQTASGELDPYKERDKVDPAKDRLLDNSECFHRDHNVFLGPNKSGFIEKPEQQLGKALPGSSARGDTIPHVKHGKAERRAGKVCPPSGLGDHSGLLTASRPSSFVLDSVQEEDYLDNVFMGELDTGDTPDTDYEERETSFNDGNVQKTTSLKPHAGEMRAMAASKGGVSPQGQTQRGSGIISMGPGLLTLPKEQHHLRPQVNFSSTDRRNTLANIYAKDLNENKAVPAGSPLGPDRRTSLPNQHLPMQMRRPSKTYTVINYGNVGKEASTKVPSGHEKVDRMDFFDLDDDDEGTSESVKGSTRQISTQLARQISEDCQSVISVASGGRKRLLSVHHVSQPDISIRINDGVDITDSKAHDVSVSIPETQQTCDGSKLHKDKKVQAMAAYGKRFAKRKINRLIQKDGNINVRPANISKRACQFLLDIFTTLLDLPWRWVWGLFVVVFVLSWLSFAIIWWLLSYSNGDFEELLDSERPPKCVDGIVDFKSAFLFSIETQHTIGYGTRAVTTVCPLAFVIIMVQSLIGVVIQCIMAGVVFAKLAKPKNRSETIMFSKRAVICYEDGCFCLVFRVGDMRRSQLVGCNLHAFLVRDQITKGGRTFEFQREHLEVLSEAEDYDQYLFLAWPTKIIHRITPDSPLWEVSQEDLLVEQFEIIVVLEGTIESSGMITQIRTSYLPSEIEWGQRFVSLLTAQRQGGVMEIDYSNFSVTEPQIEMPFVSARRYHETTATPPQRDRRVSHRSNVSFYRGF